MPLISTEAKSLVGAADIETSGLAEAGVKETRRMPRCDVVLVFPFKTSATVSFGDEADDIKNLRMPSKEDLMKMEMWKQKREAMIHQLSETGLILLLYYSRDRDEIFCKIAVDEAHLRQVAESKRHKLELKPEYYSAFAEYQNDVIGHKEKNYTDRKVLSHLYKAHTEHEATVAGKGVYPRPGAIFRTVDRIQIIDYIITSGGRLCASVDIGEAMHSGHLLHYYPLHENNRLKDMDEKWWACFAWGTDIDKVRNYYGERVALYFLFMSHFTKWLVLPSFVGVAFTLYSTFWMTPDNYSSFIIMGGMALWSMFFVHFWRRLCAFHTCKWGTLDMMELLEPTRPKFRGDSRIDPVTSRIERYYPWKQRIWKVMTSYVVLTVVLVVLGCLVLMIFLLRRWAHKRYGEPGRIWFQILNGIIVEILNIVFTVVAKWLTERENHRTERDFQNYLLAKTVVFKFVNCYISLYYIAFVKGKTAIFGEPMRCAKDDCMYDLGNQLAIFMLVRLFLQNFFELAGPYFAMWYRSMMEGVQFRIESAHPFENPDTTMPDLSSAELQSKKEEYELFQDMDEILILYGYTSLFIVACPWVPMLALISCIVEVYMDQKKLVLLYRRPFPMPAPTNEPWDTAFDIFGMLAMLTNTAVVIFASNIFERHSHSTKMLIFLAVEHSTIMLRIAVGLFLPATPYQVRLLQLQQRVKSHKHINLGGEEDDHEVRTAAMLTGAFQAPYVYDRDQDEDHQ